MQIGWIKVIFGVDPGFVCDQILSIFRQKFERIFEYFYLKKCDKIKIFAIYSENEFWSTIMKKLKNGVNLNFIYFFSKLKSFR